MCVKYYFNHISYLLVVGQQQRQAYHAGSSSRCTYNDLPTPSGNWQTHYDAQQRKYNLNLALGVGAFIGTVLIGKALGMYEFYGEFPARPATIDNYKE